MMGNLRLPLLFRVALASTAGLGLAGCSGLPSLTTGSISEQPDAASPAAAAQTSNTPTGRALQVGTTSARAIKCGYNFDPVALKSAYLASEVAAGVGPEQIATLDKIYTTGFNGVTKAVTDPQTYCTAAKTKTIKDDLARHLAGDFTAPERKVAKKADDSLFGSLWNSDYVPEKGPDFGSQDWWEKQRETSGR